MAHDKPPSTPSGLGPIDVVAESNAWAYERAKSKKLLRRTIKTAVFWFLLGFLAANIAPFQIELSPRNDQRDSRVSPVYPAKGDMDKIQVIPRIDPAETPTQRQPNE